MPDSGQLRQWRELYYSAPAETDANRLADLVNATEAAMFVRWKELAGSRNYQEEKAEMSVACAALFTVKLKKLSWTPF